eukprot:5763790-Amphidinium_carterae.1
MDESEFTCDETPRHSLCPLSCVLLSVMLCGSVLVTVSNAWHRTVTHRIVARVTVFFFSYRPPVP